MYKEVISLPQEMEIYQRDDEVILFNLLNMCYSRIHQEQYQMLLQDLQGWSRKYVLPTFQQTRDLSRSGTGLSLFV